MANLPSCEIILQQDYGGNFVDERLVLSLFLFQSAVYHRLERHFGGKAFIHPLDGHFREATAELFKESLDEDGAFGGRVIELLRFAQNNPFHLFLCEIGRQEIQQAGRFNGSKPGRDQLQLVGNGDAGAFGTVIKGEDAHVLFVMGELLPSDAQK